MISDVTFVVFHYPMADLLWVSCEYAWLTHIHQSTCEYNFLTHGATFCPISDCHSGSLAFILIHNFSPLPRKHFGSFRVSCPPTCYTPRPVSLSDKSGDDRFFKEHLPNPLPVGYLLSSLYGRTQILDKSRHARLGDSFPCFFEQ